MRTLRITVVFILTFCFGQATFAQDSAFVSRVGFLALTGNALDITITNNTGYVSADGSGLIILSLTNPTAPTILGSFDTPSSCRKVVVANNRAYIADTYAGLRVVNVTSPTTPTLYAAWDSNSVWDVAVRGNMAYAAGGQGLYVINTATIPLASTTYFYQSGRSYTSIVLYRNLAYIAANGGIHILNIANSPPTNVRFVSFTGYPKTVFLDSTNHRLYLANGSAGLKIFDITTPENPTELGTYDTPGEALDVEVVGNYAYVADEFSGLRVINVANGAHPIEVGYYDNLNVQGLTVWNDRVYAGVGASVTIFDARAALAVPEPVNHFLPSNPILLSAYPNPFNSTTLIRFSLPTNSPVHITLINLYGKTVATIADGKFTAGRHEVPFTKEALSSGTYFVSLQTPNYRSAQRVIYLK